MLASRSIPQWIVVLSVVLQLALSHVAIAQSPLLAFPGADGAAKHVTGGRGGIVYHVTKLDKNFSDNVPGTLRYGLTDSNFTVGGVVQPRTIVFDVAGTFWLGRFGAENGHDNGWDTQSRYNLGSHITLAGQTAPGPVYIMGGLVKANGTNAIVRNVTIAPGYGMRGFSQPEAGIFPAPGTVPDLYVYDAIDITGNNLMFDHVTTVYATDETISCNELAYNITVQYSNISQGQNYPQRDAEAGQPTYTGHAFGSLLQAGSNAAISIHHNLYAHQKGRLPRVGSTVGTGAYNDFRNNVFYNWLGTGGSGASGQPSFNNFVSNFWLSGPGGDNPVGGPSTAMTTSPGGTNPFNGASIPLTRIHHAGNVRDINQDGDPDDGVPLTNANFGSATYFADPLWSGGVPTYVGVTESERDAFDRVLQYMGANWWDRSPVDQRIADEVRTGTGKIRAWADDPFNADPNEGTEWRNMLAFRADPVTGTAPFVRPAGWDTDGDGMPDYWERMHGLDPNLAQPNHDFDDDGYTDLEEYLNDLAAWPAPQPLAFTGASNTRYALSTNWELHWQPSRYDHVRMNQGTVIVDAVGQHAGHLTIASNSTDVSELVIHAGWLRVADEVVIGGTPTSAGTLTLSGGELFSPRLSKSAAGNFDFTGGKLHVDDVFFDVVLQGGTIAPGHSIGHTSIHGNLAIIDGGIELELAGTALGQFDTLDVHGRLQLGGLLSVHRADGFVPLPGDRFDVMTFSEVAGNIGISNQTGIMGLVFESEFFGNGMQLVVTALPGDANLDGTVDELDFEIWNANKFSVGGGWLNGDFNLDGVTDGQDFNIWNQHKFTSLPSTRSLIPEPALYLWLVLLAAMILIRDRGT